MLAFKSTFLKKIMNIRKYNIVFKTISYAEFFNKNP